MRVDGGRGHQLSVLLRIFALSFLQIMLASDSAPAEEDKSSPPPTLAETLEWLSGTSEAESGDGSEHHSSRCFSGSWSRRLRLAVRLTVLGLMHLRAVGAEQCN
jgi:hypothetical protein